MNKALPLGFVLLLTGCPGMFGNKDNHPGTNLGTFHVKANATTNTCGDGALGQTGAWEFDVKLARGNGALYWNNGQEIITGTLAADEKSFSFDSGIVVDMRAGMPAGLPKCSIQRADVSSGQLDSATDPVMSFTGSLSYQFAPTAGSDCDDLVHGAMPIVATLPCGVEYTTSAARTQAPTTP